MASIRMRCKKCHERFTRPQGSRRIYCERCRPPARKGEATVIPLDDRAAVEANPLVESVRAELVAADRLGTAHGALAMALAEQLAAGRHTGSQYAALARELRAAQAAALTGAEPEADRLSEIAARRRARGA